MSGDLVAGQQRPGRISAVVSPASSGSSIVPSGETSTNCTELKSPALVTTANSLRKASLVRPARSVKVEEMARASPASSWVAVEMVARRIST